MATTKIQHPKLERVVYDVPTDSVSDWESAGWKVLDDADTPASADESAAAVTASTVADEQPGTVGPFTDTQGSDSPPEVPATGGSTKTTRKAV